MRANLAECARTLQTAAFSSGKLTPDSNKRGLEEFSPWDCIVGYNLVNRQCTYGCVLRPGSVWAVTLVSHTAAKFYILLATDCMCM